MKMVRPYLNAQVKFNFTIGCHLHTSLMISKDNIPTKSSVAVPCS